MAAKNPANTPVTPDLSKTPNKSLLSQIGKTYMPPPPFAQFPLRPPRQGSRSGGRGSLVSGGLNVTPALTSPRALTGSN